MRYVYPSYYPEFFCIGGDCPDTCCAGWEIDIDDRSLARYEYYPGSFGNRLANSVDFKRKSFRQYRHRCVLLNEENLCDIYIEAGEDMLCRTCRRYPRHIEEFENIRELSLSLSCPEAARLILYSKEPELRSMEKLAASEDYGDFDRDLFLQLIQARQVIFQIIQDKENSINAKMMLVLAMSHHFQRCIKTGQISGMENIYSRYLKAGAGQRCKDHMLQQRQSAGMPAGSERFRIMKKIFRCMHRLDNVSDSWPQFLRHCEIRLFGRGREHYNEIRKWRMPDEQQERLLSYFIYVWFAGAVYDEKPYIKAKLSVISTMIIEDISCAVAAKKGRIEAEDCMEAAHRYAREVEHSHINLERMEKMLSHESCFYIFSLMAALDE